jgi:RNA polymerase sigma-70 factor (ECF subfamily)
MSASVLSVLANPFRSTLGRREAVAPPRETDPERAVENQLIREAQAGSRSAFDTLVRQYDQAVLRLALNVSGAENDAQDIVQEAFLKAYRYLPNFRFECSFYTWLYRIVTNVALDSLRRRRTRREEPATIADGAGGTIDLLGNVSDERAMANPARELERRELSAQIREALDKLTPRERMVFEMKHYQGMRLRAIGEILNTTEETAKNTLFRATKKLRADLAPIHGGTR